MLKSDKDTRFFFITSLVTLAAMTIAYPASAQSSFNEKIKPAPAISIEANYLAMEKQAQKYCTRDSRRISERRLARKYRTEYVQNCVEEIMQNVLSKIQDDGLIAYHETRKFRRTSFAVNQIYSNY